MPVDIKLTRRAPEHQRLRGGGLRRLPGRRHRARAARGCNFSFKAINAEAAGAAGVIIFNQGDTIGAGDRFGLFNPTLGGTDVVDIPVVGTTFAAGSPWPSRVRRHGSPSTSAR